MISFLYSGQLDVRTNHHHAGVKISQMNASSRCSQVCFFGILATLAACGSDSESTPPATAATPDTTAPTVRFSASGSTAASAGQVVYDAIFSESLASAPTTGNFNVNNGTVTSVSAGQSGNTYKITISLDSELDDVEIKPTVTGSLKDSAGNTLNAATAPTYSSLFIADSKAPTATVIKLGDTINAGANVYQVMFSEDVTGVSTSSLTSSQGTISSITEESASLYTVTITANYGVDGDLSLTLSDAIKDDANNTAESTPTLQSAHYVDTVWPDVTNSIEAMYVGKANDGDTVTLSISATFDEMVDAEFDFSSATLTANNDTKLMPTFTDSKNYYAPEGAITIGNVAFATTWSFYFEIWDSSAILFNWDQTNASVDVAINLTATDLYGNSTGFIFEDTTFFSEWNV